MKTNLKSKQRPSSSANKDKTHEISFKNPNSILSRTMMSTARLSSLKPDLGESDTGIEILDMHRKIVEEVSKVKFDDRILIIEHIPNKDLVSIKVLSLKGKNLLQIDFSK